MTTFDIKHIAVLGSGIMGGGIAQVAALGGFGVRLYDVDAGILAKNVEKVRASIKKGVDLGKTDPAKAERAYGLLTTTTDLVGAVTGSDFVIEAVPEKLDLKRKIFAECERNAPAHAVLASNTSSLMISAIAEGVQDRGRVIGMHFFNPVPIMKLVEVIKGLATSEETTQRTIDLAKAMGKTPVPANDRAGFVSNRVLMPLINEAFHAWMEGVAKPEDIDQIMLLGCNFPMGPLRLADFIGLDVCHDIMMVLYRELGNPKFFPCPLLRQLVQAGRLGDKSGRGVFDYGKK